MACPIFICIVLRAAFSCSVHIMLNLLSDDKISDHSYLICNDYTEINGLKTVFEAVITIVVKEENAG